MKPNKSNLTTLKQICQFIPGHLVNKLSEKYKIRSRTFSPWSHVITLLYSQLSHSLSLNDVCDGLNNHESSLQNIRGATPPKRNTLSHANRTRDAGMAEELFWSTLKHFQTQSSTFGIDRQYSGVPKRFKQTINAIDSSTIALCANCLDWAQHRRQKAAAKLHLNLNMQTFLPACAIVKEARTHDSKEAPELCAHLKEGEIVIFDKAYVNFTHLNSLDVRRVFWVTRIKESTCYSVVKENSPPKGKILKDQIIKLTGVKTSDQYPQNLRLVEAEVLVDGNPKIMTFITNNFKWAPSSVAQLYQARWGIEVFFKQIKQTLQIADFLGNNKNAIQWQIWTALLAYILLRYLSFISKWQHSFSRIYTLVRAVLWSYFDLNYLLISCGTASDPPKIRPAPNQAYLPNFNKIFMG